MPSQRDPRGGITVEKIDLPPMQPLPEDPPGKPVTGLEKVRLLHNLITESPDGKSVLIPRGEVIPLDDVPVRWRTSEYVEALDEYKRDKVMLLHDMSCAVPNFDGERTIYREKLFSAYSLVNLATIPNRIVEGMREGEDYASQWDEDDRRLKEHERQNSVEEYSMESPLTDDLPNRKSVHFPYEPL